MKGLRRDTLFLAMTRPAIVFGVPQDAFAVWLVLSGEVWVLSQRPFIAGPLAALSYAVCWGLSAYDPHIFTAIFLWLRTWLRSSINSDRWGAASVCPTPVKVRRKEIIISV